MAVLARATAPLLGLLALATLISGAMFAVTEHDLPGVLVALVTIGLIVDAAIFGVLAWASATPGRTWRPVALIVIALNLVVVLLDQVGVADVMMIVVMALTALAVLATPRRHHRADRF